MQSRRHRARAGGATPTLVGPYQAMQPSMSWSPCPRGVGAVARPGRRPTVIRRVGRGRFNAKMRRPLGCRGIVAVRSVGRRGSGVRGRAGGGSQPPRGSLFSCAVSRRTFGTAGYRERGPPVMRRVERPCHPPPSSRTHRDQVHRGSGRPIMSPWPSVRKQSVGDPSPGVGVPVTRHPPPDPAAVATARAQRATTPARATGMARATERPTWSATRPMIGGPAKLAR
jgi:hypothetical protein